MVAAWTPAGIYMSDNLFEKIIGIKLQLNPQLVRGWGIYRSFFREAMEVLKSMHDKGVTSGREMEKLAWGLCKQLWHTYSYNTRAMPPRCGTCIFTTFVPTLKARANLERLGCASRIEIWLCLVCSNIQYIVLPPSVDKIQSRARVRAFVVSFDGSTQEHLDVNGTITHSHSFPPPQLARKRFVGIVHDRTFSQSCRVTIDFSAQNISASRSTLYLVAFVLPSCLTKRNVSSYEYGDARNYHPCIVGRAAAIAHSDASSAFADVGLLANKSLQPRSTPL